MIVGSGLVVRVVGGGVVWVICVSLNSVIFFVFSCEFQRVSRDGIGCIFVLVMSVVGDLRRR